MIPPNSFTLVYPDFTSSSTTILLRVPLRHVRISKAETRKCKDEKYKFKSFVSFEHILLFLCKFGQTFAFQSVYSPFAHRLCSKGKIKIYARCIPIKARPFKSATSSFGSNSGKLFYESLAVSSPSVLGLYIKVFKIDTGPSNEG